MKNQIVVPSSMKAIWNKSLVLEEIETPQPGPSEVLVKVVAAGVNRADVMQRNGNYPPPPGITSILGLEVSGIIVKLGSKVTNWKLGDEVCAIISGGGYAEYAIIPVGQLMPIPAGLTTVEAAALPETAATVWSNLVMEAGLKAGQTVLIHGGGSGIGSHAIQVAKTIGAKVVTTVGSQNKGEQVKKLGADMVINYHRQDFEQELANTVDVVFDIIGAAYLQKNINVLREAGKLIIIGMMSGTVAQLDIAILIYKRAKIIGTNVRNRPANGIGSKAGITTEVVKHVWPLIENKTVRPVISETFPLSKAVEAHNLLDSSKSVGKILLLP